MHDLRMRYRARSGFGGMEVGSVITQVVNFDCKVITLQLGN